MKIYLAAPWALRDEAIRIMHQLEALDLHEVTSRWLTEDQDPSAKGEYADYAAKSLVDIRRCDILLALNPEEWQSQGTGGRHFEAGFAFAFGKRIVLLGRRTNVFHYLDGVRVIERIEDL